MTLSLAEKSHLLRRTCFSASDSLVLATSSITDRTSLVDWLLEQPLAEYTYPDWYLSPSDLRELSKEERKSARKKMSKDLQAWWQQLLLTSNSPLYEQLTLFWHNHFVSSIQKVKSPYLMLKQNDLFRQQGLGNFKELVSAVLKDPAMLVYLDNSSNKKDAPNENLARELLELFTLGEGNYTETDVKEIARSLTGATVNRRTGEYVFRYRWHDSDEKTIFGETAAFSVEELAQVIVNQPSCAVFIATKFWYHFIDSNPIEGEIEQLAQLFINENYEIKALLKGVLMTESFWQSQGKQVKSPVQLIIGSYRQFALTDLTAKSWRALTKNMGQLLFMPPNVKGWPGDRAWYGSAAIFYREGFIKRFLRWHRKLDLPTNKTQLLAVDTVAALPDINSRTELSRAMADPAYQVL